MKLSSSIAIAAILLICVLLLSCTKPANSAPPTPPPAPTLSSPDNGASVSGTSITYTWNPSSGATNYLLIVSTDSSLGVAQGDSAVRKLYQQLGNVTTYTDSVYPNEGTRYYWWVWARNGDAWCDPNQVVVNGGWVVVNGSLPVPSAPTLLSPDNGATLSGTSITYTWSPSSGASKYLLVVSTGPSLSAAQSNPAVRKVYKQLANVTTYTDSGYPNNGATYYWWVQAGNDAGWCSDGDAGEKMRSFVSSTSHGPIVLTPPASYIPSAPTLSWPFDDQWSFHTYLPFIWNSSPLATKYRLEMNTSSTWDLETQVFYGEVGNTLRYQVYNIPVNCINVYWRVWAGNEAGWCSDADATAQSRHIRSGNPDNCL